MRLTTCKDWADKDHENFLLLKAQEWHACIGLMNDKEAESWGGSVDFDPAEEQSWFWLLTWAGWRTGERG